REIIKTAKGQKDEILSRMRSLLGEGDVLTAVENAFPTIERFKEDNIQEVGMSIAEGAKDGGAVEETVEGDHKESMAFVNLKPGKTFDTNRSNEEGWQAFNMDLWAVEEQAQALAVEPKFAQGASIILYVATEMVLVEQKGQPALPVVINA
ncbi:MAG: hypothetical protein NUV98_03445, partial [Candidatus Roizmanbacteria bacterium]|nr:hypothetical protein [Candidatus Roizmanbacteria bacterium]